MSSGEGTGTRRRGTHRQGPEPLEERRGHLLLEASTHEDPPHEGEGRRGQLSDESLRRQLPEARDREDRVDVGDRLGVLREVADPEIPRIDVGGNLPPGKVVLHVVEGRRVLSIDAAGWGERGPPPGKR